MAERKLRASEVGQYTFCPRAWWLANIEAVSGDPRPLRRGRRMHRRHGVLVRWALFLRGVGWLILVFSVIAVLLALLGH